MQTHKTISITLPKGSNCNFELLGEEFNKKAQEITNSGAGRVVCYNKVRDEINQAGSRFVSFLVTFEKKRWGRFR